MSKDTQVQHEKACVGNGAGFVYALIEIDEKSSFEQLSYAIDDPDFLKNNEVAYIGETSNPWQRFGTHRTKKSRKIGMVIIDESNSDFPVPEIQMKENQAMFNYALAHGKLPKWNKGGTTFAGA
jgi:hypothetical protein|tara:strand:+ start:341 stop:712 length:372 start_codon:yes stop_codon:yes gene_type:complete